MNYHQIYADFVLQDENFQEAFNIVRRNSTGDVWLIGGSVYRNIAHLLYETDKAPVDFDFIVESPNSIIVLPQDWRLSKNKYGNPKFIGEKFSVDFVPLKTVHSINRRGLEFTFANFLTGTPLTIQSIGYNPVKNTLEGNIGLEAIRTKSVAVNNFEQAEIYARKKGKPIKEVIREKAESLGFSPVFL